MAMLLMNDIFAGTWRGYVGDAAARKNSGARSSRRSRPGTRDFMFTAEVYWDKEYDILQQGFDFAYDKTLYDRIMEGNVQKIRQHLVAGLEYQQHMMRFIENHDEPRAYALLGSGRSYAAATLICTLPGAVLLHDGQFSGRKVKLPVQIKRQPDEDAHDRPRRLLHDAAARSARPDLPERRLVSVPDAPDCRGQLLAPKSAGLWLVREAARITA